MSGGTCARFLLVDDDLDLCRALARMVRPYGEPVIESTFARVAELLVMECEWSGFVFDIGFSDGSGLDLLERARDHHALTPAMVLTGQVEGPLINRAGELWAEYVVKPVERSRFDRFLRLAVSLRARDTLPVRIERIVQALGSANRLTEAEADVLRRSALGATRHEIAIARGSSDETVRTQIQRMLAKVGHGSLFAAVGMVLREVARSVG